MTIAAWPRKTPFVGIMEDIKARIPHYLSDFNHWDNMKVYASILFMFFTSIGPAITFAGLLREETKNLIGVVEVLLSSAITGIIWGLFSGQPLVIVGVTGPVAILSVSIYRLTTSWDISFLPFYAWSQLWGALVLILLAVFNTCDIVVLITRFSGEIFGILIASIYLYTGISDIAYAFAHHGATFESGLLSLVVTLGMCWCSLQLYQAKNWVLFTSTIRENTSDYGASIALILWTGIVYLPGAASVDLDKLIVPDRFSTGTGRDWLIDLSQCPVWAIFAAIFPGIIIAVLFFFDHNISSLMAQAPEFKLTKPSAFHYDILILGCCTVITGILGIPPTNGLIPQAPLHTKSLLVTKYMSINDTKIDNGNSSNSGTSAAGSHDQLSQPHSNPGERVAVVMGAIEQRWSNLIQAILVGIMCFPPMLHLLSLVPKAALSGLFLFMGIVSFIGNQFAERMLLIITQPELRVCNHSYYKHCSMSSITLFTAIQLVICMIIFGITFTPADMVFPLLIAVLVPLRHRLLPYWLSANELKYLDSDDVQEVNNSDPSVSRTVVLDTVKESENHTYNKLQMMDNVHQNHNSKNHSKNLTGLIGDAVSNPMLPTSELELQTLTNTISAIEAVHSDTVEVDF